MTDDKAGVKYCYTLADTETRKSYPAMEGGFIHMDVTVACNRNYSKGKEQAHGQGRLYSIYRYDRGTEKIERSLEQSREF